MHVTMTDSQNTTSILALSVLHFTVLLLISVILIALSQELHAQTSNITSTSIIPHGVNNRDFKYIPAFLADSKPYNLTYGEWTARWWQWGYSIPKNTNPAYDDTGRDCTQKQSGPVWFLAGTYGHPVVRTCSIPSGKAILLPILNSECSFAEFRKFKTLSELRTCAKTIQDQVTKLNASVDGVPLQHLKIPYPNIIIQFYLASRQYSWITS